MLGVIHVENQVRLVGASWNYPTVDLDQAKFEAEERRLREKFIGPLVFSIDQKIQENIKAEKNDTLEGLTDDELSRRGTLQNHSWAVFRLAGKHQKCAPDHWEPECAAYAQFLLS
jgi:hypothetical protein